MAKPKKQRGSHAPRAAPGARSAPASDARSNRLVTALVVVGATLVAGALIAASLVAARQDEAPARTAPPPVTDASGALAGAAEVEELLGGITQDGTALGDPEAPVTLVEFADIQCPFCAQWANETFPTLVREYVRPGTLRIELRGLAFIGSDSDEGLRAALAAGEQDRLWHVVELLFAYQGGENEGWVDDRLLAAIGRSVDGLDGDQMLASMDAAWVDAAIEDAASEAEDANIRGTPSFLIGRTGGELAPLEITSLAPEAFRPAIDRLAGS
jgi:protein-disulfide isomerase